MNRSPWLRLIGISALFALVLSGLYTLLIRQVAGTASGEVQRSIYLFIAHIIEEKPYAESVRQVQGFRAESPAMAVDVWVVSNDGRLLAGSTDAAPPRFFATMQKPQRVHELVSKGRFFSGTPAYAIVRLNNAEPTYLLVRNRGQSGQHVFLQLVSLFIVTATVTMFLGLLLMTIYLRSRSRQAKQVIGQIQSGNLSARFDAGRLDTAGGLMLDFNRMADEIQRLVARLEATEKVRRELLQELGHDLRTPLTSLKTAIDTLAAHGNAMPTDERQEFLDVAVNELNYFGKLTEDLFFIADLDEPHYRKRAERIDLGALIAAEVRFAASSTRAASGQGQAPRFDLLTGEGQQCLVAGDPHLIARLFRNVFDNAMRYARSRVQVRLKSDDTFIHVEIEDDGPGMTPDAIALFGQRRTRRLLPHPGNSTPSLGLGSVIIKTIIELHGGHFTLESDATGPQQSWTRMTISLPGERSSPAGS